MIKWQYYPKSSSIPDHLGKVVKIFFKNYDKIKSEKYKFESNKVLLKIRKDFESIGFKIEKSKKDKDKICIPVLFGENGTAEKSFETDGYNRETKTVLEVEAGRAFTNYQFLKDVFQACMMHNTEYMVVAVRLIYRSSKDYEKVKIFFNTLYASQRLRLPLKGILLIGY